MKHLSSHLLATCLLVALVSTTAVAQPTSTPEPDNSPQSAAGLSGASATPSDALPWTTEEFEIPPNKEIYLCYSKTLDRDMVVGGYSTQGQPFVHHLIFSRARLPGKEGFEPCPEAFRSTWDPVFLSGAGSAKLDFPVGAGQKLTKGTQMVVQMHLLNTQDETVRGKLNIDLHRSTATNPRPRNVSA